MVNALCIATMGVICFPVQEGQLISCDSPVVGDHINLKPEIDATMNVTPEISGIRPDTESAVQYIPAEPESNAPEISGVSNLKPEITGTIPLKPSVTIVEDD